MPLMLLLYGTASSLELFLLPFDLAFVQSWPPVHLFKCSSVIFLSCLTLPFLRNGNSPMLRFLWLLSTKLPSIFMLPVNQRLKIDVESKTVFGLGVFLSFYSEKWLPAHFWIACVLLSPFQKDGQLVKIPCYCQVLLILVCTLLSHKKISFIQSFFLRRETEYAVQKRKNCAGCTGNQMSAKMWIYLFIPHGKQDWILAYGSCGHVWKKKSFWKIGDGARNNCESDLRAWKLPCSEIFKEISLFTLSKRCLRSDLITAYLHREKISGALKSFLI